MSFGLNLLKFDDQLFQLIRTFPAYENFPVQEGKDYLNCDTVLKKDNLLYFCRKIEDAQVIEESYEQI